MVIVEHFLLRLMQDLHHQALNLGLGFRAAPHQTPEAPQPKEGVAAVATPSVPSKAGEGPPGPTWPASSPQPIASAFAYGWGSQGLGFRATQRAQYPLIKEYTLNPNIKDPIFLGIFLTKGYWVLWAWLRACYGLGVLGFRAPPKKLETGLRRSCAGIAYTLPKLT